MFKRNKKKNFGSETYYEQQYMMGKNLSFAASEAYKLLRTNVMFSFANDEQSRVIGITSSFKGEGKTLTAINLAHSISETGKKVLLIECDLRLPTISKRLQLNPSPGLSNLLVGLNSANEVIQQSPIAKNMHVMTAGDIPPNASELLESSRMEYTIEKFSEHYDYIILDLPPVTVVSDALIASKFVSGMIVVVREDYANKGALADTMRQLKYVNAKVLGFVYNSTESSGAKYQKKYKKYYKYGYDQYDYGSAGNGKTK